MVTDPRVLPPFGPGSRPSFAEQELVHSLDWLISLRWLAGLAVLFATPLALAVFRTGLPAGTLTATGLAVLAYNALFWWTHRVLRASDPNAVGRFEGFARLQIVCDWVAMAVLISLTGGAESPAMMFFLFHITIASLLLPHHLGFLFVTLAPVLVIGVAALEYLGVLPHASLVQPTRYRDLRFVVASLGFFTVACYVMAYCCLSIARRLRRRESELGGLYVGVRDITSTLEITAVLDRIVEAVPRVLGCRAAAIRLLDPVRSQVEFAASCGLSESYRDEVPAEYARSTLDLDTLRDGLVLVLDVGTDPRVWHPDRVRDEGIATMLSVAIVGRTGPIGVLRAYGGPGHRFSGDDVAYLQAVATHGAVAIENAKAYRMLSDLDRDKSRFLRMTTHELRSPVRVTESLLMTLANEAAGPLVGDQRELVLRAQRRLGSLHALIDDLLDLAAGKADMVALKQRRVDARDTVREVVERFLALAESKRIALTLDLPDEPAPVWCDPGDLERIVVNLVSNAVKYTPRGGVAVHVAREGDRVRLEVADSGIGIPPAAMPHLFEEFYRAENAKAVEDAGTGLGLSIVKQLVERLGGQISVSSLEGSGTTFNVDLPRDVH